MRLAGDDRQAGDKTGPLRLKTGSAGGVGAVSGPQKAERSGAQGGTKGQSDGDGRKKLTKSGAAAANFGRFLTRTPSNMEDRGSRLVDCLSMSAEYGRLLAGSDLDSLTTGIKVLSLP